LRRRILYVQYTNPTGYPPLEHSSRILAESGWDVLFLGTGAYGGADSLCFPDHPRIRVEWLRFQAAGWRQKLHYLYFSLWVLGRILTWRPDWLYFSMPLDLPLAWLASWMPGVRVVYHEHDCPGRLQGLSRIAEWPRRSLFRRVLCVWPNLRRAEITAPECRHRAIVWNCPRRDEVSPARQPAVPGQLEVFYHGSINATRLPIALVRALALLPAGVRLTVVGYETIGAVNHSEQMRGEAARLGIADRLVFRGQMSRFDSMRLCREGDVGITFMPLRTSDLNEDNMIGPSNKAFDYLAGGVALLMADRPDWREAFAGTRPDDSFGMVCDPQDPATIAAALRWFLDHPVEMRAMGERGRRRILEDWNYETQFRPVQEWIEGRS
jgi:glycosyltransferase involved in cell wall biosynthesis